MQVFITLGILLFAIVSFIREKIPAHITALLVMGSLLATGIITTDEALSVFSNSATAAIAALFVISAALKQSGLIDQLSRLIISLAEKQFWIAVATFYCLILVLSAFMNNTPVVIIMTPVIIMLTKHFNYYPSKFLIPLSYVAILGGMITLIGTSTNILVNGIVVSSGMASFNIFTITPPALVMAAIGISFMLLVGRKLLPARPLFLTEMFQDDDQNKSFLATAMVPPHSPFIGKTLGNLDLPIEEGLRFIEIIRNDVSLSERMPAKFPRHHKTHRTHLMLSQIPLQAYDRLVIRSNKKSLLELKNYPGLTVGDHPSLSEIKGAEEATIVEGIIGPESRLIGNPINATWVKRLYNCHIWALHRRGKVIEGNFSNIPLEFGDVLLIEGTRQGLDHLFKYEDIVSLTTVNRQSFSLKALISLCTLIGVIVLAACNVMPIAGIALVGATVLIGTRCLTPKQAYESIDWQILLLIFGMLSLSIAMEKTGIIEYAIHYAASLEDLYGPRGVLTIIYFITTLMTELMSNNAVAVLVTPVVLGITGQLGLNPVPYIVTVMFAASASFATPLGYQTNTYVYNAGNYRFSDFLKVGIPMNLLMWLSATFVIPFFWPLQAG